MYAQVIVDISHSQLDKIFEYAVPANLEDDICIGHRVMVPFGPRHIEGFVLALENTAIFDIEKIKPISKLLDAYPVFLAEQIDLAQWMADKYNTNIVDTLRLMIPAQLRGGRVKEKKNRIVYIDITGDKLEEAKLSLHTKDGRCKAPLQLEVLRLLNDFGCMDAHLLNEHVSGASSAVSALEKKGWVHVEQQEVFRNPYENIETHSQENILTQQQQSIVDTLSDALLRTNNTTHKNYVLRGVTGSGKTEVYLQMIKKCLEQGKSAIMLVPEISLTPQTVERFFSRFGNQIAVLHSRLSAGERYDEWRRVRLGEAHIVVGARSAVFAPCENIGLIVIDEEHESSYQSDKTPRYHAIDVAKKRCSDANGILLLGSATPSIETWYRAKQHEFHILQLPKRINNQPMPEIEVVDMRIEMAQGNKTMFSSSLYRQMKQCFWEKKQIILFLNRRGYSTFISCRGCGYVFECEQCDVSMTYHKSDHTVRCHYCDNQRTVPAVCPQCGKPYLKHFGVGTQQVEEQVLKLFPGIRTVRMDYDTTQKKNAHHDLLEVFRKGEADVLIGTQMIAKGLDFPNVMLVGVIAADATLFVPDYRSAERAFQLITQVAGRAGRDHGVGHVVVQSYSPKHPSIVYSSHHDFEAFYDYEIESRKQGEFPPFTRFVRLLFTGENDEQVRLQSVEFQERLRADLEMFMAEQGIPRSTLLYTSVHEAPMHRLRGLYRHQVMIKIVANRYTDDIMHRIAIFTKELRKEGFLAMLELNPQNMM